MERLAAQQTPLAVVFCVIMELRHLKYFCTVVEHRSSRPLQGSQRTGTGSRKKIRVSLFRRNQREVTLTPEGTIFFHEAREIRFVETDALNCRSIHLKGCPRR